MATLDDVKSLVGQLESPFAPNAFLVFTLGLSLGNGDYEEIHRSGVLDGPDDKKIDFHFIDWETGRALFGQGFESPNWDSGNAPANKASDLNTAISWLLDAELDAIPRESIRAAAEQLRDGLSSGQIHTVEAYFVHNCTASNNVDDELTTVHANLRDKLGRWAEIAGSPIASAARQLSLEDVVALYDARYSTIRVTDLITLKTENPIGRLNGPQWRAIYTVLPASAFVELLQKYGDSLYSANIRDWLGTRAYARNINSKIVETARDDPENFWTYNNGITLISRRVEISEKEDELACSGLAVVNGAQTIGSLSDASDEHDIGAVLLLVRIIESADSDLIQDIIRFNNTQNPIKPWELRVLDPVQKRIEEDFEEQLHLRYQYRRGVERRAPNDVLSEKLGPWLNSFYGDPITSHRNSPEIFDNDVKYRKIFNENSDVHHLLFAYRLGEAIGATKDEYRGLVEQDKANETQRTIYGYFRYGAFTHVVLYLAGEVLSEVFGGGAGTKNRMVLDATLEDDSAGAIDLLKKIVQFTLAPLPAELTGEDAYEQLRSKESIQKLGTRIRVTVNQFEALQPDTISQLKEGLRLL